MWTERHINNQKGSVQTEAEMGDVFTNKQGLPTISSHPQKPREHGNPFSSTVAERTDPTEKFSHFLPPKL